MIANTQIEVFNPTTKAVQSVDSGSFTTTNRTNKRGVVMGTRTIFNQHKSAAELRAEGKAAGKSGKDLTKYVNDILSAVDELQARTIAGTALFQKDCMSGYAFSHCDTDKKGNKKTFVLVKVSQSDKQAEEAAAKNAAMRAKLMELGLSEEEIDKMGK